MAEVRDSYPKDDSEWVQRAIADRKVIEDRRLFFARTVYVWPGSGGLKRCHITSTADPVIFASRNEEIFPEPWMIPLSDCQIMRADDVWRLDRALMDGHA